MRSRRWIENISQSQLNCKQTFDFSVCQSVKYWKFSKSFVNSTKQHFKLHFIAGRCISWHVWKKLTNWMWTEKSDKKLQCKVFYFMDSLTVKLWLVWDCKYSMIHKVSPNFCQRKRQNVSKLENHVVCIGLSSNYIQGHRMTLLRQVNVQQNDFFYPLRHAKIQLLWQLWSVDNRCH